MCHQGSRHKNPVNLQKEAKYELMEPKIPRGVIVEGDMLGAMSSLKFVDHDLSNEKKFLDLAQRKYLNTFIDPETSFIIVEPKTWETGLEKSRILNLLQIPHFGRSPEINLCENVVKLHPWWIPMAGIDLCPLIQR
jgi:hypothetical protein